MRCVDCRYWITVDKTVYEDGAEIIHWASSEDGHCTYLAIRTTPEFGCMAYVAGDDHAKIERKDGAPWQHFKMIPCPDCAGVQPGELYSHPAGSRGHRCAGTGLVRLYDDGHVGDEQTRLHPKQKEYDEAVRAAEELAKKKPDGPGRGDIMDPGIQRSVT